jgi:hypothetical protein
MPVWAAGQTGRFPGPDTVEVWTPGDLVQRIEREQLIWEPPGATGPFVLTMQELFKPL